MKKHTFKTVYIAVFLVLCLIPSLGMLFGAKTSAAGNEMLASKPKLVTADGKFNTSVLSDTADYIADRFAFRQQFVTAWAELNAEVFNTSAEEKVLLGKDGWLFYSDTLNDYQGIGMTDAELAAAARNLSLMREYVESRGADFLFTIAPNKNSLYGEYMQPSFKQSRSSSNAVRFADYLKENAISYADLFFAFDGRNVLYYATDSHWTNIGAAVAADKILGTLGIDSDYGDASFSTPFEHSGDLYEMLYPAGSCTETDYIIDTPFSYKNLNEPNGGDAITIKTQNSGVDGSLICWRDSFGKALYPYLAEKFGAAVFSRAAEYDLMQDAAQSADTVMIELVERNLRQLIVYGAVYPAPIREVSVNRAGDYATIFSAESGKTASTQNWVCVSCELPAELADILYPAYIKTGAAVYEASTLVTDAGTVLIRAWLPAADSQATAVISWNSGKMTQYQAHNT